MNAEPPTDRSHPLLRWARPGRIALVLFGAALAVWLPALWTQSSPVAGGADSSGYLNYTRLLLEGRVEDTIRRIPGLPESAIPSRDYAPLGFRVDPASSALQPTYPIGYPLVLAPFHALFGGRPGTWMVLVLAGMIAPLLVYRLARETGLPVAWAAFCAVALVASPLFQMQAYSPMTDVPTTAVATAALLLLLRFDRGPRHGLLLGFVLALGVLTRPANILLFAPVAAFLLLDARRIRLSWTIVLGGLPGAALQVWLNLRLYGTVFTTSYGDFSSYFDWAYVLPSLRFFLVHGVVLATPMVLLGLLASPAAIRRAPDRLVPLAAAFAGYVLFYAAYYHSTVYWWSLRFILPVFPAAIILGAHGWHRLLPACRRTPAWRELTRWIPVFFIPLAAWVGTRANRTHLVHYLHLYEAQYAESAAWLADNAADDDVIVCMQTSGSVFYYLPNPIVRSDLMEAGRWQTEVAPALARKHRIFASLFPHERTGGDLDRNIPGPWRHRADFGLISIYEWVDETASGLEPDG